MLKKTPSLSSAKYLAVGLFGMAFSYASPLLAFDPFVIQDIRVEGLQRVAVSEVFKRLSVEAGDEMGSDQAADLIKALYASGDFTNVEAKREGRDLVILLSERPSVNAIAIDGNKVIKTDDLIKSLKQEGLSEGGVFQRSTLERMTKALQNQYSALGYYAAQVTSSLQPKPRNRLDISILIDEGEIVDIKHINFIGNTAFDDKTLAGLFKLKESHFSSFFKRDDQYARERMNADLETLKSFYLDRGYIQFAIESTRVSIDPDHEDIFITVSVNEGVQHTVNTVKVAGEIPFAEDQLNALLKVSPGQTFSNKLVTETKAAITDKMGDYGYTFANVSTFPEVNYETNRVDMTFLVELGKRVSVRRIHFEGNERTADQVLRREMRQMEGAWASSAKIERSKQRLQQLGFFKGVAYETRRVPGTEDQVDIVFSVEEQPSGSVGASIGYQAGTGLLFGANLSERNFLGTGNQVDISLQKTDLRNSYRFKFVDPYYTVDGVSRGFDFYYSETDFSQSDLSRYRADSSGLNMSFGYPISENARLNFSVGLDNTKIFGRGDRGDPSLEGSRNRSATEVLDFIGYDDSSDVDVQSDSFLNYIASASWRRSTLNRGLLPDRGSSNRLFLELALPGSDVEYYKLTYLGERYFPVSKKLTFKTRAELGVGGGLGETDLGFDGLPFYKHFFAGGVGSVRGYRTRSLGPKDDTLRQDPFGGDFLTELSAELIFPMPFVKDKRLFRSAFFLDAGNVFDTDNDDLVNPEFAIDIENLQLSLGVGFTWITAIGPIGITFAKALDYNGDDDRSFEFTLGQTF